MDDMISRQAVIDICDHAIDLLKGQFGAGVLVAIKESIEELPPVQFATDTNVGIKLGTNLAEVGTDCISRQAAIDAIDEISREVDDGYGFDYAKWRQYFCELPSVLGTNLAEVGTDCISRQQAIDAVKKLSLGETDATRLAMRIGDYLERLTSAKPEIIRCKDCKWCEDADGLMCKNTASWVVATGYDFGCVLAERRQDG